MTTIYKFPCIGRCKIAMPVGTEIVRVALQDRMPCMWGVVPIQEDPAGVPLIATTPYKFEEREFQTIYTGGIITGKVKYIGSYETPNFLMYHIFELLYT